MISPSSVYEVKNNLFPFLNDKTESAPDETSDFVIFVKFDPIASGLSRTNEPRRIPS